MRAVLSHAGTRAWLPTALALIAIAATIELQGPVAPPALVGASRGAAIAIAIGRLVAPRTGRLAAAWLPADAGLASWLVLATGAWFSPYYFLVISGAWWAAHRPIRYSGVIYASVFVAIYLVASTSASLADGRIQETLEDVVLALVVALLADWFVRVDRRAVALSGLLANAATAEGLAQLHRDVASAAQDLVLPLDSLLVGTQLGLKLEETQLLGLLMLGLTNQQIAEVIHVSVATVKYRLTRLYRRMKVGGRAEAISRGRSLALLAPARGASIARIAGERLNP